MRKLRLLCLHGQFQNAEVFASKCQGLQRWLQGVAELDHLQGTHEVIPTTRLGRGRPPRAQANSRQPSAQYRAWWTEDCQGWDTTLFNNISAKLKQDGPYQGVLGFSQGATAAGLMCTRSISARLGFEPKLAIMIAGRRSLIHDDEYESGIVNSLACIHSFGEQDQITPAWKSELLLDLFQQDSDGLVVSHIHGGGHIIPDADKGLGAKSLLLASKVLEGISTTHQGLS